MQNKKEQKQHLLLEAEKLEALARANRESASALDREIEEDKRISAQKIPVDRTSRVLSDGSPVTEDHRELKENGQQKEYVVLSESERAKGFVRPIRTSYIHEKCGTITTMGRALAETYARDPYFYSGTFCCGCGKHFPVGENGAFIWAGEKTKVGT